MIFSLVGVTKLKVENSFIDYFKADTEISKGMIVIDEKLIRPAEVDTLLANYSKAKKVLNWSPEINFDELVVDMIESDLKAVGK